jgi:hypothetical protein
MSNRRDGGSPCGHNYGCGGIPIPPGLNLAQYVQHYLDNHAPTRQVEGAYWGDPGLTLDEAILRACRSHVVIEECCSYKFQHQWRLPNRVLESAGQELTRRANALGAAATFDELWTIVQDAILPIDGVGPLLVYDVAERLGIRLDRHPEAVYLHAGVTTGARNLGLNVQRPNIPAGDFPHQLHRLTPAQIEDFLCLYKAVLHENMD